MATLVEKVREKIASGALPTHEAPKIFVGQGHGARCNGCEFPITDLEYEFDSVGDRVMRLHRECFQVWDAERTRATAAEVVASKGAGEWVTDRSRGDRLDGRQA